MSFSLDSASTALADAVAHLRDGGVVAVATETFFSLCADARRPSAIESVFALKDREEPRACALLLPEASAWPLVARDIPKLAYKLASRFWPGQLTISLRALDELHPLLRFRGQASARVPGPSPALELVRAFGHPLFVTSANPSGFPSPLSDEDVRSYFDGRGHLLVLPGRAAGGTPSTVVEVHDDQFTILRHGAVPTSVIEDAALAS